MILGPRFSISGNDLQVTDFVDRENPKPLSITPLAWKVDQIENHSEFLIQLEEAGEYYMDVNSSLRRSHLRRNRTT